MSGENLRDWLEVREDKPLKMKLYKSKHDPDATNVKSSFGSKVVVDDFDYGKRIKTKPAIPKRTERTIHGVRTKKNFVMANAIEAILKNPEPARGRPTDIRYRNKKDFGKVPDYLNKFKKEAARHREEEIRAGQRQLEEERRAQGCEFSMDEEERHRLLKELKTKWDEYNKQYQRMAHIVQLDTAGKIKRKEFLETQLKKIERAIEQLEKGPVTVYSANTNNQ